MKAFFLFVIAVTAANSVAYGQQPALQTCSQQVAYCNRFCENQEGRVRCIGVCQQLYTECMATGLWRNYFTGQTTPARKEYNWFLGI
jgi:hypothetical protein